MVILNSKQKKFEGYLKIKLCGKRLYPTGSVKYQSPIQAEHPVQSKQSTFMHPVSLLYFFIVSQLLCVLHVYLYKIIKKSIFNIYII